MTQNTFHKNPLPFILPQDGENVVDNALACEQSAYCGTKKTWEF
jgi:hypothetical protein